MASTVDTLRKRIDRMLAKIEPPSKTWVFLLEEGQSLPDSAWWQIRPHDRIVIREVPTGFLEAI